MVKLHTLFTIFLTFVLFTFTPRANFYEVEVSEVETAIVLVENEILLEPSISRSSTVSFPQYKGLSCQFVKAKLKRPPSITV